MTEKMKNILIGLFVVSAVTIAVAMVLFLEPTIGDGKKTLHVRFANISGIMIGTRVTFAGKPVGEVVAIEEIKDARKEPSDDTGRVYLYELTLKVDSSVEVYNTDDIAIRTTGLMGERSVAILPKVAPPGKTSHLVNSEVLYANSIDPLENTFNQITKVATKMEGAVTHLDNWFVDHTNTLSHTLGSMDGTLTRIDQLLGSVQELELVPSFRETTELMNRNLRSIQNSLEEDQLLHKIANLAENLDRTADSFSTDGVHILKNVNQITHDLAMGTGTIGKLITGEDFYLRFNSLLSKAETLMNDINHYGLLFQYDKGWQRNRTKKANLLKALDTPKEFRSYFEGEIDSINVSLGRLTELLEKSDSFEKKEQIASSDDFKRQFATLFRRVQNLSDAIRLYNQELVSQSNLE